MSFSLKLRIVLSLGRYLDVHGIQRRLIMVSITVQLFHPFRTKFMKIAAHAHMNELSIINLVLS